MDYASPAAAFNSAFQDSLTREAQERRQALLDKVAYEEHQQKLRLGEETLEEKRLENRQKVRGQKEDSVRKRIADMVPGDIPAPDLIADAKEVGVPLRTEPDVPTPIPSKFGVTSNETTGGIRFAGSPKQAEERAQRDRQKAFIDALPDDHPRKKELQTAFEAESVGLKLPAGYFEKPTGHTRVVFDDRKGVYYGIDDPEHKRPLKAADIPRDAQVDRMSYPSDHTSGNENRIDRAYENAVKDVETRIKPAQGHIDAINELGPMLNARTPTSDSLIAPLVIKATISGQGSGFRMTQGEINQVLGARSHWDSLAVVLNAWKLDPSKALKLTDTQRDDMHKLILGMRAKASKLIHQVNDARNDFDDAAQKGDENMLRRKRTEIMNLLNQLDPAEDDKDAGLTPPANPKTPNARPRQEYDAAGNLIKKPAGQ